MAKNNKKNGRTQSEGQKEREEAVELQGTIEEALPGTMFRVRCEGINSDGPHIVIATLSGKLRMNHIRIVPGDFVTIEVSPYDLTRGRVTWRK